MGESLDPSRIFKGPGSLKVYVPPRQEWPAGVRPRDYPNQKAPDLHYMDYVANYWIVLACGSIDLGDSAIRLPADAMLWLRSIENDVRDLVQHG
jgi:hypothetical protein